jgi:small subunit ribosomal protein S7
MPPRLLSRPAFRSVLTPSKPTSQAISLSIRTASRGLASKNDQSTLKMPQPEHGTNQQSIPHVSEEAATMSKITGQPGPDMSEGTPIQEVFSIYSVKQYPNNKYRF